MSSTHSTTKQPPTLRRERRNWRLRAIFSATLRRGPVRYWPLAAFLVALAAAAAIAWRVTHPAIAVAPIVPYSAVAEALSRHQVSELVLDDHGARVEATLRKPLVLNGQEVTRVQSLIPAAVSMSDVDRWSKDSANVRVLDGFPARSSETLIQALTLIAVVGVVLFVIVKQRGGLAASKFLATPSSRRLTLADVGGVREAQADLRDVIAYLKQPERFRAMGAKCPKGVLLIGPPGTGKTLLARAVAGEAGVPVIQAAGSDFNEMYVGVGSRRVRQLAKQARESAPCIVFIDEFDSLGGRRGRPNRSGEEEVTLNQLLVEMDGMSANEGVVWMAATNREDMLDPAVRRPGRFDRIVEVPLPTAVDRLEILKIHAARSPLSPNVDLERLSQLTVGHSGADLANLLNEAAIIAVQSDSDTITNDHVEQARDKILLGRVRSGVVVTESERRLIALHEAGHAVVGVVACPDDKLHKVTIEPRGRSLGAAHFAPEADRHLHPRHYLEGVIAKALGGRAAETIFLGRDCVTTGAGSDLVQATGIARRMVAEFGMSDEVGLVSADNNGSVSSQLQSQIDTAVRSLMTAQSVRAEQIVTQYRDAVEEIANALIAREILDSDEVYAIAAKHGIEAAKARLEVVAA
ncbi:MAG: AAA family ATPase [Gemmatimonadota bacterium]|nr:AAA family ATPase [Gemmatimonadota bacterium]